MKNNKILPVCQISDWIIIKTSNLMKPVTTVKLQQLLYYCQVWHLVEIGSPLFLEDIQAWSRGPVVVSQYERFKKHLRKTPIVKNKQNFTLPTLQRQQKKLLERVVKKYIDKSELEIELQLFREMPFLNARKDFDMYERGTDVISYSDILAYYEKLEDNITL